MKKLKFLAVMCIILCFASYLNAQKISSGSDVRFDGINPGTSEANVAGTYAGNPDNYFPHVKGPYKWTDGTYHEGIWKNDTYMGDRTIPPYEIETRQYITHLSFQKISQTGNEVRIKIMQNGRVHPGVEDFAMAYDSGNQYCIGNMYGIENITFPLSVRVTYRSWNTFHAVQSDVVLDFIVNYPGRWNVIISN